MDRNLNTAMDLMLKSLAFSPHFNSMLNKNWVKISKAIPGTTAKQCEKRYQQIMEERICNNGNKLSSTNLLEPQTIYTSSSRPSSSKNKATKPEQALSSLKLSNQSNSEDTSPVMVIHVRDEAKNIKQDFHCSRDLLVREMKYFAEYLSTDLQRMEEVDISVHCDVQIFKWLMNYVKRQSNDTQDTPKLEATNVISILISSHFLKMDQLVQECIEFCHKNMDSIVATPCNMNCIDDSLVTRISELFTHNEADLIKDRKDKFKSKIFSKKIEKLFKPDSSNADSPENASTLFRCSVCKRILTKNLEKQLACETKRILFDKSGQILYSHLRDPTWDVNEYLIELKSQLKQWRDVYWRVWGTINFLSCSRCGERFPCMNLAGCRYHSESVFYQDNNFTGTYPCCGLTTTRFDPIEQNKGCCVRDHLVNLPVNIDATSHSEDPELSAPGLAHSQVYNDLLEHRDLICIPHDKLIKSSNQVKDLNIFGHFEQTTSNKPVLFSREPLTDSNSTEEPPKNELLQNLNKGQAKPRLEPLTVERQVFCDPPDDIGVGESEDEAMGEEGQAHKFKFPRRSRITIDSQAILMDAPDFTTVKSRRWDSTRSNRWNQDSQREEDQRRMNEMIAYLIKLRLKKDKTEKNPSKMHREYAGGIFSKLETQWKASNMPPPKAMGFQARTKPRSNLPR